MHKNVIKGNAMDIVGKVKSAMGQTASDDGQSDDGKVDRAKPEMRKGAGKADDTAKPR